MPENAQITSYPKRWSSAAIDAWMERLSRPQKKFCNTVEEQKGREIYESQPCIELDLKEEDVLARFQSPMERVYVIIEASREPWRCHSSLKNTFLTTSYQIATLHCVEELICDYLQTEGEIGEAVDSPDTIARVRKKKILAADQPRLEFRMNENVLEVTILSLAPRKTPVPGESEHTFHQREKGMWLRFLFHAKRAGFVATNKQRTYALHDRERIAHFYRQELPRWETWSDVILADDLKLVAQDVRTVKLIPEAEALDSEHVSINWTVPGLRLQENERRLLMVEQEEPIFLSRRGWVRPSKESLRQMAEWKQAVPFFPSGILPHYMLFSSYGMVAKDVETKGPLKEWLAEAQSAKVVALPIFPKFLRPYQIEGIRWICHLASYHLHGLLADDMGLGKTLQVLMVIDFLRSKEPSLVVCPASVVDIWYDEAKKFFPHMSVAIIGKGHGVANASLYIVSYAQLRIHKAELMHTNWNFAVLDEAQWIKNAHTKIFQICLGLRAKTRLALTGTPIENCLQDLWNLFRFLMPGFLGTWKMFQERTRDASALLDLQEGLRPFVLRRTKEEVLRELPIKSEVELHCPMLPTQQHLYFQTLKCAQEQYRVEWSSSLESHRFSILAQLTRLRQLACDPSLVTGDGDCSWKLSGKILQLESKLSEVLWAGKKVVIFSQFVRFLEHIELLLQERFPSITSFKITGTTVKRGQIIQEFQELSGPGVILISLRAGGVGISLTTADYVFLMDPWWNPSVERQAIDRVHRWGRKHSTIVYRFISSGTLEESIQKLKMKKDQLFRNVLDPLMGPRGAADFFLKNLKALLRSPDAMDRKVKSKKRTRK
ncbi:MAG: DEAD/DEAH box helicase [Puniceicoccales bacterium]|jgi:superfamily II DNA or RNA helicase|nr:DEAD/DEAH box helicase [Puniceicoccales bacterium]